MVATTMGEALVWHRLQFGFTIVYHYLFPQLTMGLALLIVLWKAYALRTGSDAHQRLARFWVKVFGINFAVGVVTGLPMEFQFGTNWARFSKFAGGVIGQTLGMEGLFAFFLESSFLGLLLWGEERLGPRKHFFAAVALLVGSWLSGYFIVTTNAFMQHPVGYTVEQGRLVLMSLSEFLLNPWAMAQYAHNMMAAVVTASFVVAAVGAFWQLRGEHLPFARLNLKWGTRLGLVACVAVAFPTGDIQAKLVAKYQPVSLAAMEGRFESGTRAPISLIGQPNIAERKLDNPIRIPGVLSFLAFGTFRSEVKGLAEFPESDWPTNIELLYYAFHIMVGLGTILMALMSAAVLLGMFGRLERTRPLLWALCLAFPFPYIANTAGWMTAELGRQPWLIYGLFRTADGTSATVHSGDALFTLIGTAGLYFVLGLLYVFLMGREIAHGPDASENKEAAHG